MAILYWKLDTLAVAKFNNENIRNAQITLFSGIVEENGECTKYSICFPQNISKEKIIENLSRIHHLFESTSKNVGFNTKSFGLLVLEKYYKLDALVRWRFKHVDIFCLFRNMNGGIMLSFNDMCSQALQDYTAHDTMLPVSLWDQERYREMQALSMYRCESIYKICCMQPTKQMIYNMNFYDSIY